jgi:hypothetical protein
LFVYATLGRTRAGRGSPDPAHTLTRAGRGSPDHCFKHLDLA